MPEQYDEATEDWRLIKRRQVAQQMETISNQMLSIQMMINLGVASGDFPNEFRSSIKRQALQLAAIAEVQE